MERYTPLAAQVRARREAFCFWTFSFIWGDAAKLRWAGGGGARSALFGVRMSPKKRVRAAHGRAREAKTH
jgi:hypothetical protein